MDNIWQWIAVSLGSLIVGVAPGYFIIGPSKMSRTEVSEMIKKEAPMVMQPVLSEIREAQTQIRLHQSKLESSITLILQWLKK